MLCRDSSIRRFDRSGASSRIGDTSLAVKIESRLCELFLKSAHDTVVVFIFFSRACSPARRANFPPTKVNLRQTCINGTCVSPVRKLNFNFLQNQKKIQFSRNLDPDAIKNLFKPEISKPKIIKYKEFSSRFFLPDVKNFF